MLTQEELKRVMNYNPDTGVFRWKVSSGGRRAGTMAGGLNGQGYIVVRVKDKSYRAHRLAFLYQEGFLPENSIDHINRDRTDNRWSNLREASQRCNIRNACVRSTNKSGVKGVHWETPRNKWRVTITVDGHTHHLGTFTDFTEAVATRFAAEQCLGFPDCDSSSLAGAYLRGVSYE